MKKKSKIMKILSFFTMCVMALSMMTVNVQAEAEESAGKGSLTLQNTKENSEPEKTGSEYAIYQIFVSKPTASTGVFEYEWADAFADFGDTNTTSYGKTMDDIKKMASGSHDFKFTSDSVDELTPLLERYIDAKDILPTKSGVTIGQKVDGLAYGYYLILETETPEGYKKSKPMLVEIPKDGNPNVIITVKEQVLTIEKKIIDDENKSVDTDAPQVGDEITFQVTYDVPKYADDKDVTFKIVDTMGKGLTFAGEDTVKVYKDKISESNLLPEGEYAVIGPQAEGEKTKVTFDFSSTDPEHNYYANVKDANKLIIQYKATLNEDAEFGPGSSDTNVNTVVPTYGKDTDIVTGKEDKTKAYSGAVEIIKKDADGGKDTLLPGAEFTVYEANAEGNITENIAKLVTYKYNDEGELVIDSIKEAVSTTGKDGKIRFDGLGEGIYFIKETKSPGGYILLEKPIKVEVKIDTPDEIVDGNEEAIFTYIVTMEQDSDKVTDSNKDGLLTLTVENEKGFSLPTTGGMGTYLFTIGGIILMAAAAVLLIRSRKKA